MRTMHIFMFLLVFAVGCDEMLVQPTTDWQTSGQHLVAFTLGENCRQCVVDKPKLRELEAQGVNVIYIDGRDQPDLARQYGVTKYPYYVVLDDGEVKGEGVSLWAIKGLLKSLRWIVTILF